MVEVRLGKLRVDGPYLVQIPDVSEEQFDKWVDEKTRAELLDGVMIVHSPASPAQDDLGNFLRGLMRMYASATKAGRVFGPDALVRLAPRRKYGPDAFFIAQSRLAGTRKQKQFEGAPDLVVEILSPSNHNIDLEVKRPRYQEAGVNEIWLIDRANEEVHVDVRKRKRYATEMLSTGRLTSAVLAGFWIEVDWLWEDPLPEDMECLRAILGE